MPQKTSIQLTPSGIVTPEKYTTQGLPNPGAFYQHYGEQKGYIYDPILDKYRPDPKVTNAYYQSTGLQDKPQQPPSTASQLGYLGATTLGPYGVNAGLGAAFPKTFGTAAATTAPITAATTQAAAAAPIAQGAGLLGSGAAPVAAAPVAASGEAAGATLGGTAAAAAPFAGIAAGGYGTYENMKDMGDYQPQTFKNYATSAVKGSLSGAAAGAGIGTLVAGPVGTLVGGAIGFGVGEALGLGKVFFGAKTDTKQYEKKMSKLAQEGLYHGPINPENRSPKQIVADYKAQGVAPDFVGFDKNGQWINMKFASDRKAANLRAPDITNYPAFYRNITGWEGKSQAEKEAIANQYLQAGAVKEGGGDIKLDQKKVPNLIQGQAAVDAYNSQPHDWQGKDVGMLANAQGSPGRRPPKVNQGSPGMRPQVNRLVPKITPQQVLEGVKVR